MKPKLTYANLTASLALFLALGGTAVAARHYLITSTGQISPHVLSQLHGKAGPAGPQGPGGPQGPQGPAGPTNLSGIQVVNSAPVFVAAGTVGGAIVYCPAGTTAISGGGSGSIAGIDVSESETGRAGWFIITDNETLITVKVEAQAFCAGQGQAVAAGTRAAERKHMEQHVAALVARLRAEKATQG